MERDYRNSSSGQQQYPIDPQSPGAPQYQQSASRPWMTASESGAACAAGSTMGAAIGVLSGAALGAAAMYLLDPDKGHDRRHHLAEAAEGALETTTDTLRDTWDVLGRGAARAGSSLSDRFSDAASSVSSSLPSRRQLSKRGNRFLKNVRRGSSSMASSFGDTADSWLDSARSYLPSRPQLARPTDVSATTAGLGGAAALAIGVGAMWLFDPRLGRSRRAWLGQKATRLLNETGQFMRATGRHLANKSKGYYYDSARAARQAAEGVSSSFAGGSQEQQSTGDVSSAHNVMPRSGTAVGYGLDTGASGSCPPGTVGTTGTSGSGI